MNANDMNYEGAVLHVLRGLPRAGKSTLAATIDGVIVSKDSIRLALHGKPFVDELEPEVHSTYKAMVSALLYSGHRSIILDECFLTAQSVDNVRKTWPQAEVKEYLVATDEETCVQRAIKCGQAYLVPVIRHFATIADWLNCKSPCQFHGTSMRAGDVCLSKATS